MSTNAHIGILNQDGSVQYVYCHYDGYPEYTGKILQNNFNDSSDVLELLSFGDIRGLERNIDETEFFARDRGEKFSNNRPVTVPDVESFFENDAYLYLYVPEKNEWHVKFPEKYKIHKLSDIIG